MRECRSRSMSPEKRASERKTTRREPPETSRRGSEKEKEIAKKLFSDSKTNQNRRSLIIIRFERKQKETSVTTTTTTHFSCSIFASCNLTTAFVQCDPQSMPYFSCSNALFFVLDASTAVVPKDDERRTMRDKVARHIVLLERGIITREELCFFFFMTTKISSSLLLQSVQKVGRVSLSRSKSALLSWWGFARAY